MASRRLLLALLAVLSVLSLYPEAALLEVWKDDVEGLVAD
jgi:hypothetical protein